MGSAAVSSGVASRRWKSKGKIWTSKDFEQTPFYLKAVSRRVYDQKQAIVDHHELEILIQRIFDGQPKDYMVMRISYSKEGLKVHPMLQPRKTPSKKTTTYLLKDRPWVWQSAAKTFLALMKEYEKSQYSLFGSHCQSICDQVIDKIKHNIAQQTSGSIWELFLAMIKRQKQKRRNSTQKPF